MTDSSASTSRNLHRFKRYPTVEDINACIHLLEAEVTAMRPGLERQAILVEIAKLKQYAAMKRLALRS